MMFRLPSLMLSMEITKDSPAVWPNSKTGSLSSSLAQIEIK